MTGLVSGEGVSIELTRAGLGTRSVAAAIDLAVQAALLIVASIITGLFAAGDSAITAALVLTEVVLVLAGYPIVFEWLSHGRTLGKRALGLRVVRDDGGPTGFRQALVRGLSGFIIEKPGIALGGLGLAIAMITIGASKSSKRLGDMMAGTFVINERAGPAAALKPVQFWVPPQLYGWAQSIDLSGLNDQLALQLRQFVLRAAQMSPAAQAMLGEQFRAQVLAVISPQPHSSVPTPVLLTTVLAERRRRADLRAMAPAPYPNTQPYPSWPAGHASAAGPGRPGAAAPDNPFTPPS